MDENVPVKYSKKAIVAEMLGRCILDCGGGGLGGEAWQASDVPEGELCQGGPDGQVDAKSAKKSNNLVSIVLNLWLWLILYS